MTKQTKLMKRNFILLFIFLAIVLVLAVSTNKRNTQSPPILNSPSAAASDAISYCTPDQLESTVSTEGAAGSIYATLTMKNLSTKICQVYGNKIVAVSFAKSDSNVKVTPDSLSPHQFITLQPGDTIYSQIKYPNGPQCSRGVVQNVFTITYPISESDVVNFVSQDGNALLMQVCTNSDITDVLVWPFMGSPVTK